MLRMKRAYDPPEPSDGTRVLVDRIWPRGVRKEQAKIDLWLKAIAPSTELRKWYGHDPAKFAEFQQRYEAELKIGPAHDDLAKLRALTKAGPVTLVFAARDAERSNAAVLHRLLTTDG